MINHKLEELDKKMYRLLRNDNVMRCPIIPPTIMQVVKHNAIATMETQGQPDVQTVSQPMYCNSNCPLFNLETNPMSGKVTVDICCGKLPVHYDIDEVVNLKK